MSNLDKLHELKRIYDKGLIEHEVQPIFLNLDFDGSGLIDFKE